MRCITQRVALKQSGNVNVIPRGWYGSREMEIPAPPINANFNEVSDHGSMPGI